MIGLIVPEPVARQPWGVILPLSALVVFGASVLYSAAGGHLQPWAVTHIFRFCVFLVMALIIARFPREWFKQCAYPIYAVILVLLLLVELLGAIGGGSQRWLNLGFMHLQPSELMKPAIVLALALFYDSLPPTITASWRGLVPAGLLIAMPTAFVMLQPDLGTALAICFGGFVVMFLAGLPVRWFVAGGVVASIIAPIAFFTFLHDYQRKRVLTFFNPENDPLGSGYHITQSKIAIGSGGFSGKGFGNGSQSHLEYLPEAHTDFVFATMAEEWGMIGGLFILLVFFVVLRWGMSVARNSSGDRFASLLAGGMTLTIFFYICVNLMMVMGLAPVVGIPLPFMSHGGSSMMTNMICVGTIMAVRNWQRRPTSLG